MRRVVGKRGRDISGTRSLSLFAYGWWKHGVQHVSHVFELVLSDQTTDSDTDSKMKKASISAESPPYQVMPDQNGVEPSVTDSGKSPKKNLRMPMAPSHIYLSGKDLGNQPNKRLHQQHWSNAELLHRATSPLSRGKPSAPVSMKSVKCSIMYISFRWDKYHLPITWQTARAQGVKATHRWGKLDSVTTLCIWHWQNPIQKSYRWTTQRHTSTYLQCTYLPLLKIKLNVPHLMHMEAWRVINKYRTCCLPGRPILGEHFTGEDWPCDLLHVPIVEMTLDTNNFLHWCSLSFLHRASYSEEPHPNRDCLE